MPTGLVMAIAHRGGSAYAPENTLAAFEQAIGLGCRAMECDVRLSRDGVPVLCHDATLERTTTGRGRVADWTFAELAELDAGGWFGPHFAGERIPSLEQALEAMGSRAQGVLELKTAVEPAVLEGVLLKQRALGTAVVISFEAGWLRPLRRHNRELQIGLLAETWTADLPERCVELGAERLVLSVDILQLDRVAAADERGLEVWCYTANDVGLVAAAAAMGVRGIITDRPDLIREK